MNKIKILIHVIMIFLWAGFSVTAFSAQFGETGTGSGTSSFIYGRIRGTQFVCTEDGNVNRLWMYIPSVSTSVCRMAIYTNGGVNLPGTLLCESSSQAMSTGWNEFIIPDTTVTSGTVYWICSQVDGSGFAFVGTSSDSNPLKTRSETFAYAAFPLSFPPPANDFALRVSAYASEIIFTPSYTPITTLTSTPTLTPTPTPLSSLTSTPTVPALPSATQTLLMQSTNNLFLNTNQFFAQKGERLQLILELEKASRIKIIIFNILGEQVRQLVNEERDAGQWSDISWDGTNQSGNILSSGLYFIQLESNHFKIQKKVIIIN